MLDRFGNRINIAWSEVEILWLQAAVSLPTPPERFAAYRDIAGMTGRGYANVKQKALSIQYDRVEMALDAKIASLRKAA